MGDASLLCTLGAPKGISTPAGQKSFLSLGLLAKKWAFRAILSETRTEYAL